MKYTIEGFQQEELLKNGLDCTDAVILRYIIDFYNSDSMVKKWKDNKEYFWLKYSAVIEAVPLINIKNKTSLSRRMEKYIKCGLMEKWIKKDHEGTFSLFRWNSEKYTALISAPDSKVTPPPNSKVKPRIDSKVVPKDSSIKDYSINDPVANNGNPLFTLLYQHRKDHDLLPASKKEEVLFYRNTKKDCSALMAEKPDCLKIFEWATKDDFWKTKLLRPDNYNSIKAQYNGNKQPSNQPGRVKEGVPGRCRG